MGRRCRGNAERQGDLFRDEEGFTTVGMVLALLLTLALVFTSAQVYRVNSASAEVQHVADAAALSAETQVAEFMIIARFCDAVVLSLSLSGIVACGLGVAAACVPAAATISAGLVDAGKSILKTRDNFSRRSAAALEKLQEALPFFAAACAAGVAAANNGDSNGSHYVGVALLVPAKGEPVRPAEGDAASKLADDTGDKADEIRHNAQEAEDASRRANEAKERAFQHDCGANPDYCMYERAGHLAGLSGSYNPLYSSVDTWSFSVALERAKHYYADRRYNDAPTGYTVDDTVRWKLRQRFYEYAYQSIAYSGYVSEGDDWFSAYFPHLPRNTDEMRATSLYTEAVYPISFEPVESEAPPSEDEAGESEPAEPETEMIMHAWEGCPGNTAGTAYYGSISYMESVGMKMCPVCEFKALSLGRVASASTSIDNGFEYHYEAVAREAEAYGEAISRATGPKQQVKEGAGGLFDELVEALKQAVDERIQAQPPGRYGAIAFVANVGVTSAAGPFGSGFVATSASLGPRAAIASATLIEEDSDEGRTVLNSLLDGVRAQGGIGVGAVGVVLDAWSNMLTAYADGLDALTSGVESGLNAIPLASVTGLGSWASGKLKEAVDGAGLQPAELKALKPVLVNSAHVAAKDDGRLGQALVAAKQRVVAHPLYSTDLFSALLTDAERQAIAQVQGLGDTVQIASIELLGPDGPSIPVEIPLPEQVKQYGVSTLQAFFDRVRALYVETTGVRIWE